MAMFNQLPQIEVDFGGVAVYPVYPGSAAFYNLR